MAKATAPSAKRRRGGATVVGKATAAGSASRTAPKVSKSKQSEPTTAERRRTLAADVEAFLKSGQKIEQVPTGVSGQDRFGRSKHIVLGRGKSRG